ncbi:MAG TPA: HtaA domain-containing protein [Capillimicrobium sp.]|nr:HtaA domain-containing protein [Capillimicrobium sp.]
MILDPPIVRHIAALAAVGGVLAVAPAAGAQDTTIALKGPAARSLADQGVRVTAVAPARRRAARITLPTGAVTISGRTATVRQKGALRLRAGRRVVVLRGLEVRVGSRSSLRATVGGRPRTIGAIAAPAPRRSVQPTGTYVTEAPLRLTSSTVRMLRRELRRPGLRGGRLGTIDLEATTTPGSGGTHIPGAPEPTVTGPPTPGGATVATRPAGAVPVTGGAVRWSPRESWLGYLQSGGEPASVGPPATFDGATYTLPITGGWFDPASGATVVDTAGSTSFRYAERFLDMRFANWTWDLAGAPPKAVATVERATGVEAGVVGSRQPILLLKPAAGARPAVDGSTVTWTSVPATLAAEGVPIFRAYLYDTDQGSVTISATIG